MEPISSPTAVTGYPFTRTQLGLGSECEQTCQHNLPLNANYCPHPLPLGEILPVACKKEICDQLTQDMGIRTLAFDFELKLFKLRYSLGALKQHGPRGSG